MKVKSCIACLTLGLNLVATAGLLAPGVEKSIKLPEDSPLGQLKPGPNVDVVRTHCIICHSTDYIVRQPPGGLKEWEGEVQKMIKVYGAPVSETDAAAIVEYLATAYGDAGRKNENGSAKGSRK